MLGCSGDDALANKAFADAMQFDFLLLCDTDLSVARAYDATMKTRRGLRASRTIAVIDEEGTLEYYWDASSIVRS